MQSLGLPLRRARHARHRAHSGRERWGARARSWVVGPEEAAGSPVLLLLLGGFTLEQNTSVLTCQQSSGVFFLFLVCVSMMLNWEERPTMDKSEEKTEARGPGVCRGLGWGGRSS